MLKELVYRTQQGDTWDLISFKHFGTEIYSRQIAEYNSAYIKYVLFPPGVIIYIPSINKQTGGDPPWL